MKYFGILCILFAGTMLGFRAADRLNDSVRLLRTLRELTSAMTAELQNDLPLISGLLRRLAAQEAFSSLRFLQTAAERAEDFPACWPDAVRGDSTLPEDVRPVLLRIGQTLGSTTLEGQTAALALYGEQLSAMQQTAEEQAKQKGTLCRSFGILAGMFFVILLL